MLDFLQYIGEAFLRVAIFTGFVILPIALFLYLVIAHGGLFFSPKGRVNRLAYWEGLAAWLMFNIFTLTFVIMYMMYSANFLIHTLADKTMGDADYSLYTKLFLTLFFIQWVFALGTLIPVCAKRWHDLNLPGALAAINAAPVLLVGWVLLVFFNQLGQVMFQHFITDANALGPGMNAFTILNQAALAYSKNYIQVHPMYYCFVTMVMLGAFLYLGLSPNAIDAAGSRKKAANASPRPSRA